MLKFEYKTFEDISDNYLNYLGIDGWELCGIKNYDKSTKFYFKRQLQEEPKDNITITCGTRIAEAFDKENSHIQRVILDVCRPTANRQMLDYTKSTLADLVMYRSTEDFWRTNGCGRKTFTTILDVLKRYGHILLQMHNCLKCAKTFFHFKGQVKRETHWFVRIGVLKLSTLETV